jgi:hypothetical protein
MGNPPSQRTPTTTRKGFDRMSSLNLEGLNRVLMEMSIRLAQVEAIGQNPDMKGRRIKNLAAAEENSDAVPKSQLDEKFSALTVSRIVATDANGELASVDLDDWIAGTANRITVTDDGAGGVTLNLPDTPQLVGLLLSGLTASRMVGTDGTKNLVSVAPQAAEADAGAASAISLAAGADHVDRAAFNTALGTLVSEINGIRTTLNNLLAKLRTLVLIAP